MHKLGWTCMYSAVVADDGSNQFAICIFIFYMNIGRRSPYQTSFNGGLSLLSIARTNQWVHKEACENFRQVCDMPFPCCVIVLQIGVHHFLRWGASPWQMNASHSSHVHIWRILRKPFLSGQFMNFLRVPRPTFRVARRRSSSASRFANWMRRLETIHTKNSRITYLLL